MCSIIIASGMAPFDRNDTISKMNVNFKIAKCAVSAITLECDQQARRCGPIAVELLLFFAAGRGRIGFEDGDV